MSDPVLEEIRTGLGMGGVVAGLLTALPGGLLRGLRFAGPAAGGQVVPEPADLDRRWPP